MSSSASKLTPTVFNRDLYTAILTHWFGPTYATAPNFPPEIMKRWFAVGTPEENAAFDAQCKSIGQPAFDALHPDVYPLPPFESFARDREIAGTLAEPFLGAIEAQRAESNGEALKDEDVALALTLLLDQLSRNTYRKVAEQKLVYAHFDRLSRALLHQIMAKGSAVSGLDRTSYLRSSVMKNVFAYMPLMHSEDLADHDALSAALSDLKDGAKHDKPSLEYITRAVSFEDEHRELIERFKRYPHRNAALSRDPTAEETKFLESGGKTFGVDSDSK